MSTEIIIGSGRVVTENQIHNVIEDCVSNLLFYDRKGDEELHVGDIEQAISEGMITVDEIVGVFKKRLVESIEDDT